MALTLLGTPADKEEVQPRRPITVVLSRFEDLVARGLRAFVEDDGALYLLASDVSRDDLERSLTTSGRASRS